MFSRCLSVYRGGLGLCPGGVCPGGLSREELSVLVGPLSGRASCPACLCLGDLCPMGSLSWGSLSRGSLSRVSLSGRPPLPVDRQTPVKILSCPKLRLRAVITNVSKTTNCNLRCPENYIHQQHQNSKLFLLLLRLFDCDHY